MASWTIAMSTASAFMVLGETAGGFGRAIMAAVAQAVVVFSAVATGIRATEAVYEARRAIKGGTAPEDIADALAPRDPALDARGSWISSIAGVAAGGALAYLQASIDDLIVSPAALQAVAAVATWVLPSIVLQRSFSFQWEASGLAAWFHQRVRVPVARGLVRLMGGRLAPQGMRGLPSSAPTELLVGEATEALFALLPAEAREALAELPAAASALAEQATALRARDQEISAELRGVRTAMRDAVREERVEALEGERAVVQGRLGTTIAALESIRLDLLRLRAGEIGVGNLTEQLEVVRELRRQVDAVGEVERVVGPRARELRPEPTPV